MENSPGNARRVRFDNHVNQSGVGMLVRGGGGGRALRQGSKYGPMAEEAGSACDCKTKH